MMPIASAVLAVTFAFLPPAAAPEPSYLELVRDANAHFDAGRYPDAASAYERAITKNPFEWQRWYRLALSLYRAKEYRRAIPAYERALELGGSGGTFRADQAYDIACCHALLGEKEEALAALRRALDLGATNLDHIRGDADLESLRADSRFRDWLYLVDAGALSRDERWRYDLRTLAREIERIHWSPFRVISKDEFEKRVRALHDEIPSLSDPAVEVRLMQLMSAIGDGHTRLLPDVIFMSGAPVQLALFEEGLFVVRAAPAVAELAGAEVLRIADAPVAAALAAVGTVISRESEFFAKHFAPLFLRQPRILNGLGLVADPRKLPLTLRTAAGTEKTVVLESELGHPDDSWVSPVKGEAPLSAKNPGAAYWFEFLEPERTVYFQYNRVENDPKESLAAFCERLFSFVSDEKNDVRKLVIDLRRNGGGDMTLNRPLVHGLIRAPRINRRGALFVIVGRETFSAAMNAAADIERETEALFVGEPTGSSPNHVGESNRFQLPCSGLRGTISNQLFQRSQPFDSRTFIAPRLFAPPTFADFASNRDAATAAILREPMVDPR